MATLRRRSATVGMSSSAIGLRRLRSCLPPVQNDPELYGAVTEAGIGKAEARAPRSRRVFCLAVTSDMGLGRGRPPPGLPQSTSFAMAAATADV